ncbi:MAG: hypothetical protein RLZZ87_548 [Actinomycetota bacterium]
MSSLAGRPCSRVSCRTAATMTLTYIYAESRAVLGPIAMFSEPHAYDLCERHAARLTVPNGWTVERELHESEGQGPSEDDLMAIADAVREVARNHQEQPSESTSPQVSQVGRRGHLRAVPS